MRPILDLANNTFFVYYLLSNVIYLVLLVTALAKNTSSLPPGELASGTAKKLAFYTAHHASGPGA